RQNLSLTPHNSGRRRPRAAPVGRNLRSGRGPSGPERRSHGAGRMLWKTATATRRIRTPVAEWTIRAAGPKSAGVTMGGYNFSLRASLLALALAAVSGVACADTVLI